MTLGDLIKEYREKHNISMDEFSKMCNLSKGYISMLENNTNPRSNKPIAPTLPTIKKIALAMNADVDFILKAIDSDQEISLDSKSEEPAFYMTKEEIGEKLKAKRISCGMTQQEVAEKIGRKQPIVGHWETGYSQPDANTLFMLCDIYGTTVDDVFGFTPKENFSKSEYDHIKKYRALDDSGREHVDTILQWESDRVKQLTQATPAAIVELHKGTSTNGRLIEYFRSVSAGTGQVIFDDVYSERITMPDIPEYRRVAYAVKVDGRSMEPLYNDGDILLIEPTCEIDIGEIGIFNVNGLAYVKQLGQDRLISLNKGYDDIPLTEDSVCMGRVVDKLTLE